MHSGFAFDFFMDSKQDAFYFVLWNVFFSLRGLLFAFAFAFSCLMLLSDNSLIVPSKRKEGGYIISSFKRALRANVTKREGLHLKILYCL